MADALMLAFTVAIIGLLAVFGFAGWMDAGRPLHWMTRSHSGRGNQPGQYGC